MSARRLLTEALARVCDEVIVIYDAGKQCASR